MPNWSGHATWQLSDPQGQPRTFHHEPRLTYVDFNALRNAALLGVGIALLLEDGCRQDVAEGRLVEVLPNWTTPFGTIYLAFTSKRGMRPSVRTLVDFIAAGYRF